MRRLPHLHPEGAWLFVTFHLHGSLPHARYPPPDKLSSGKAFVWMDRFLDTTGTGPYYLQDDRIAEIVERSLETGVRLHHYELNAYVIMSNHIHALLLPLTSPAHLMRALKGSTAREANLLLGRTGTPFWQAESYDHWVRNADEFARIRAYIENNPVKAGLVSKPEDYRWSSAAANSSRVRLAPSIQAAAIPAISQDWS